MTNFPAVDLFVQIKGSLHPPIENRNDDKNCRQQQNNRTQDGSNDESQII